MPRKKTENATATPAAKKPAATKRPARARAAEPAEEREPDEGEEREEREDADDASDDDRERDADPDAEGEVVEADAEIVDEDSFEGSDAAVVEKVEKAAAKSDGSAALSRTAPMQAYLREVQRHKLLTPEEEKSLTTEFQKTQDPRIAMRLVTSNLRLVVKLAYEYRRAYKNIMDLVQ